MLKAVFTLDYEIHGNGTGCPYALMVEPTERLMRLFEKFGAKLTIMADIGEILRFKKYSAETGRDDFHYEAIAAQLCDAIRRGHDVQLHIHSSYFNARHENGYWVQDWSEYDFANLNVDRMDHMVKEGKQFLESLLRPIDPSYRCHVFRAANWSVCPSHNVVSVLVENGIEIDTSVFKYGRRKGRVTFDYTQTNHPLIPWRADQNDLCQEHADGKLHEFPIYAEKRWIVAFFTMQRIYRAYLSRIHKFEDKSVPKPAPEAVVTKKSLVSRLLDLISSRHAWKADFNQCNGGQLIDALERAHRDYDRNGDNLPFVLIGHSKLYTHFNELSLKPFLNHIKQNQDRFGFAKFNEFRLDRS